MCIDKLKQVVLFEESDRYNMGHVGDTPIQKQFGFGMWHVARFYIIASAKGATILQLDTPVPQCLSQDKIGNCKILGYPIFHEGPNILRVQQYT